MTSPGALQRTRTRKILQRSVDVVVAIATLFVTLPVVVLAGLAIKISSPRGPVLTREVRVGKEGESFEMLRLRTTTSGDLVASPTDASTCDAGAVGQRVTMVGRILRRVLDRRAAAVVERCPRRHEYCRSTAFRSDRPEADSGPRSNWWCVTGSHRNVARLGPPSTFGQSTRLTS